MIASIILFLHLSGIITAGSATTSLFVVGALLLIAELGVTSMGLITLNAIIALYAGYALKYGGGYIFGVAIGWPLLFGFIFLEFLILGSIVFIYVWLKSKKAIVGTESMVGESAIINEWNGTNGLVHYEGEIWKAHSDIELDLDEGSKATIESINKLDIKITI